jgi:hypothetical protein
MCPGERERGGIMIKCAISLARGVTGQASYTVIGITGYTIVLFCGFRISMAGDTGILREISGSSVAIYTGRPLSFVRSAVDWKILAVMVKCSRYPCIL